MQAKRQFHSLSALPLGQEQTGCGAPRAGLYTVLTKKAIHAVVGN